ncbi:uncharacterized protein LOC131940013 [Physella acuta]|uniref:uncharacterized protein LOC131940013 n=1 Tax=Physella acuta TaxID=109671 RepID=UPI0027DC11C0|nr:uncharacterized protein LOC131940013 [Physella acuta]
MATTIQTTEIFEAFMESEEKHVIEKINGRAAITSPEREKIVADLKSNLTDFVKSRERIKELAREYSNQRWTAEDLTHIVTSLVKNNEYVAEAIAAAFYFCWDLLKTKAQGAWDQVKELFSICTGGLTKVVTPVVEAVGGWRMAVQAGKAIAKYFKFW